MTCPVYVNGDDAMDVLGGKIANFKGNRNLSVSQFLNHYTSMAASKE